jgi:RNA polymerase sigma factor (sigma-70 family)
MADGPLDKVLHHIRRLAGAEGADGLGDRELLERFVTEKDESAFAALVQRHGAMVLSVSHRVLSRRHDAEDAFQATFLVLARRAASVRGSVGGWLHAVAYRVARRLRANLVRRPAQELGRIDVPQPDTTTDVTWREVRLVLDEELNRLPEKYRAPLILCYLEGLTQDEAAHQLGWPRGVLRGRLDRGRERLRARLVRRGVGLSTALLGAALAGMNASAGVPAVLAVAIVKAAQLVAAGRTAAPGAISAAAAALTEEVTQTMITTKLCTAALALATLLVVAPVAGVLGYRALAGGRDAAEANVPPPGVAAETEQAKPAAAGDRPKVIAALKDIGEVVEPEDLLAVSAGQARLLVFKEPPKRLAVSDDKVASYALISPTQFAILGTHPGWTTWYVWFEEPAKADRGSILSLVILVEPGIQPPGRRVETPKRTKVFEQYVKEIIDPKETITLKEGNDRLILLKQPLKKLHVADPKIVDYETVGAAQLILKGLKPGVTVCTLWFPDGEDKAKEKVFTTLVQVKP